MGVDLSRFDNAAFDRGAGRGKEFAWLVFRSFFFLQSFLPCYATRRRILRGFGADVGDGVIVKPGVKITFPWKLILGDHCWLGEDAWILDLAEVRLGDHVCISQRAFLCTGNHDWSAASFPLVTRPITIESGAWIGASVFVGPGVTIGRNAVVTAGSVVTDDLPADSVCSGNPCVPVKPRVIRD